MTNTNVGPGLGQVTEIRLTEAHESPELYIIVPHDDCAWDEKARGI